jgi:hypothetical protein
MLPAASWAGQPGALRRQDIQSHPEPEIERRHRRYWLECSWTTQLKAHLNGWTYAAVRRTVRREHEERRQR